MKKNLDADERGLSVRLTLLAAAICVACSSVCPPVPKPVAAILQLREGTYTLTLVATRGTRHGASASGHLTLLRLAEPHWGGSDLYGFTDVDLAAVGAPVLANGDTPHPSSRDPGAPGVLVENADSDPSYASSTPVLLIGTSSNVNPVLESQGGSKLLRISSDGAGIGLLVHHVSATGFVGRWTEWGIVRNGRGRFCAQRAD